MIDTQNLQYTLDVIATDSKGKIKSARYLTHKGNHTREFIPNRLYLYLLNRGLIKAETWKVPFILGAIKIYGNN